MAPSQSGDAPDVSAGFTTVDRQPDTDFPVATMDATARWPAVRYLKSWERSHLALQPGEWIVDVGCGPGDVTIGLCGDVGAAGHVLGLDASTAMLDVARRRAAEAGANAEFGVGDAQALALPDGDMDACRSERMLQWVPAPERALAEMVRVVRPGGRVVIADTDWRSLMFDLIEPDVHAAVTEAFRAVRGPGYDVGGRLLNRCRDLGLVDVEITAATQVWTHWNPDTDDAPIGFFPLRTVMEQLGDHGMIDRVMAERFVLDIEDAGRRDRLFCALTMFAVYGRRPA
jgi:ubiquinone/menaquinone biosynthesis C-methylase UbiE